MGYVDSSQIEGLGTPGSPAGGVVSVQFPSGALGPTGKTQIINPDGTLNAGVAAYNRLRVSPEGTCQFIDHFDFIDVNKWGQTTSGSGLVTYSQGSVTFSTGTNANSQSQLQSVPRFEQQGNVYLEFGCNIKIEAAPIANVYRFWGVGLSPSGGSTYANPLQDGMGFELDGAGVFRAVIYSQGTRVFAQTITIPTDGGLHRYAFFYNTQFQYWYGQSLDSPVASNTSGLALTTQILPLKLLLLTGTSAPATAPTFLCGAIAITDTGRNNSAISDGTYPFRKAQVNEKGSIQVSGEGSDGRVKTGQETLLFFDAIEGTVINPNIWNQKTSGMTIGQANALQTLNANSILTSGSYAILQSLKYMPLLIEFPLYGQVRAKLVPASGAILEIGFMNLSGNTSAPTDGCFLRWDATGAGYAVVSFNGSEILTPLGISVAPTSIYNFEITIYEDHVEFEAQSTTLNSPSFLIDVPIPGTQGSAMSTTHVQVAARVYNTSATSTAAQIILSGINCNQQDLASGRSYREQLAVGAGRGSYQYPVSPYTSTANVAYNQATALVTLSGTTPGYNTLGGTFYLNVPTGNDAVDYAVFGFQVPKGYQLHLTQITIDTAIASALAGPTIFQWALGVNSTGASLATADSVAAGTYAPRKIPVGQQSYGGSGTATNAGVAAPEINIVFDPGVVVDSERYLHLILKIPVSTVGAGTIRGSAMIRGYFE